MLKSSFSRYGKLSFSARVLPSPRILLSLQQSASTVTSTTKLSSNQILNDNEGLVKHLQQLLESQSIDALIIPTDDPHMSEYTADYYNRRAFISGFTGSAGTVIVTQNQALLFTDGRYHRQAEIELNQSTYPWTLMRQGIKGVPTMIEFLSTNLTAGQTVGVDTSLISADQYLSMAAKLSLKNISMKASDSSEHVDQLWGAVRPAKPSGLIRQHNLQYAGLSVVEKLVEVRKSMAEAKALVVGALDEIMWLFNIRGGDVACNPVAMSYGVVTSDEAFLCIDEGKVSEEVRVSLESQGITIKPYEAIEELIKQAGQQGKVWMDKKTVNYKLFSLVPSTHCVDQPSPIVLMKAKKNDAELDGMRAAHLRDGAAMAEFLSWLYEHLSLNDNSITEVEIDQKLTACRAAAGLFVENSFPTIAGVNENAAIIHYRAVEGTCKSLSNKDMLLLDSGGQYLDGTTDVTRTFHFGEPTDHQKQIYTRVLKGHIGIDTRVFPVGTPGCLLDTYAREHLWKIGKNFIHGTGHGVGAALNVHEGPQRISPVLDSQGLLPGMILSNEPGYYEPGNFGVRIENLLIVKPRPDLGEFAGKGFASFERLTLIPIDMRCVDLKLLTEEEVQWINDYHQEVKDKVFPLLKTDRAKNWLIAATQPIARATA